MANMVNVTKPDRGSADGTAQLVFLHAAQSNIPVFEAVVTEAAPGVVRHHEVMAELLARAEREGLTDALEKDLRDLLSDIAAHRPRLVVCTCSTLGGLAERLGAGMGLAVERIDRALAEAALDAGNRIMVLAATPATLQPTEDLFRSTATGMGLTPKLELRLVEGAWPLFLRGDLAGYHEAIAAAAREVMAGTDVIVLAQVSMAPAKALLDDLPIEVLTSPEPGMTRALARLGAAPT
jgi:hypothetical protein